MNVCHEDSARRLDGNIRFCFVLILLILFFLLRSFHYSSRCASYEFVLNIDYGETRRGHVTSIYGYVSKLIGAVREVLVVGNRRRVARVRLKRTVTTDTVSRAYQVSYTLFTFAPCVRVIFYWDLNTCV